MFILIILAVFIFIIFFFIKERNKVKRAMKNGTYKFPKSGSTEWKAHIIISSFWKNL